MPDRLFLVHGMGKHEVGWEKPIVALLEDLYGRYRIGKSSSTLTFDERFHVVPIGYDDIFRDLLAKWKGNANALGKRAEGVQAHHVTQLIGWLRGVDPDEFVWSHAADVLLYRLFVGVRETVKTAVASQIVEELVDLKANESWSVIAHSLGTAVAHDALDMLWTGKLPGGQATGFSAAQNKAQLVMMVANVSRVLETTPDVYESTVRPGDAADPDSGCFFFLNARHDLDPFTRPRMFAPRDWPTPGAISEGIYWPVEIWHIHQKNVHAWEHYLENPAVHIPMLRMLTFDTAVTRDEEQQAIDRFEPFDELPNPFGLKRDLEHLQPSLSDDWTRLQEIWSRYQTFVG